MKFVPDVLVGERSRVGNGRGGGGGLADLIALKYVDVRLV